MRIVEHKHGQLMQTRQRGVVLIVALVVLLILSMLGISGMQGTIMEERMAGNMADRNLAFQAAEAALRAGESAFAGGAAPGFDVVSDPAPAGLYETSVWSSIDTVDLTTSLAGLSTAPEYILETQQPWPPLDASKALPPPLVKVSARAVGRNGTSEVVLQSIYKP